MERAEQKDFLKIGEIAQLAGLSVNSVRQYEQRGLLKTSARSEAGHRLYSQEEVVQLQFIKRANLSGLTLAEVKDLLALVDKGERGENLPRVNEVLEEKIQEAEQKMEEISAFRESLFIYLRRFKENEDQGQR